MAFPWAGFGAFLFYRSEMPLDGTDTGWNAAAIIDEAHPLGAATSDIQLLGMASAQRKWDMWMEPGRLIAFGALQATWGTLTDWRRPTPDSHRAFLLTVEEVESKGHQSSRVPADAANSSKRIAHVRVTFVRQ